MKTIERVSLGGFAFTGLAAGFGFLMILVAGVGTAQTAPRPDQAGASAKVLDFAMPQVDEAGPGVPVRRDREEAILGVQALPGSDPKVVRLADVQVTDPTDLPADLRSHIQGDQLTFVTGQNSLSIEHDGPEGVESDAPASESARGGGSAITEFEGLDSTGWIPPDTVVAVGDRDILESTNSGFAVYSKRGRQIRGYTTFTNFFANAGTDGLTLFDPRVQYNPSQGKYVMLALGLNSTTQVSFVFIAISQTSAADGAWWLWRFDAESTDGASWMDYAGLGADTFGIYYSGNMFNWAGGFRWTEVIARNPAMWTGGASNGWRWSNLTWPNGSTSFGVQPVNPHSINSNGETYFVNTYSGFGSSVTLWTLTGDRGAEPPETPPVLAGIEIGGLPMYYALNENVDQPDTPIDIDGGDSRVMNAIYANRRVFFTLGSDQNNDGSRGSWLTAKLNSDTGTVEWNHNLWTTSEYYTYPALTLQGSANDANLGIFGTWTNGTDRYPSTIFKIYDDQPNSTSGPFLFYQSGVASYVVFDSNNRNRWGDYSGADFDWTCGHLVGAAEWTDALNSWSTQVLMTTFDTEPDCQLIDITFPGDGDVLTGGQPIDITWTSVNLPGNQELFVFYSLNGDMTNDYVQIGGGLPASTTSLSWTPPVGMPTTNGKIFVGSWDAAAEVYTSTDRSDGAFEILGCAPDSFEPDDTSGQASSLVSGSTQAHSICPVVDEDWALFTLAANSEVILETSGVAGDTRMWLYDASLNEIEFDDDDGADLFSLIDRSCETDPLPAGTYYVQIDEFGDNDEIANYDLDLTATACSCAPDSFEPDDTSAQANVLDFGLPQDHSICPVGDEDWMLFSLAEESQVEIGTSGAAGDTRMWLYDSNLSEIEFDDDDGQDLFSFIDRTCDLDPLPAGLYYVQIDEFGDNDEIEAYEVLATASVCSNDRIFVDGFESGDTSAWSSTMP